MPGCHTCVAHTNIQDIAPTAGVQPEGSITSGAILALEFTNVFVETGLMGDVSAGELEDTFAAEGMLQRFFAHGAFAPDKSSLTTVPVTVDFHDTGHISRIRGTNGQTAVRTVYRVTTEGAKRAKG